MYCAEGPTDNDKIKCYLENTDIPKITVDMKRAVDQSITMSEISRALKELKSNRTPGCDRLPPEFYKVFWLALKDFIYDLFMEIVEKGKLHLSARRGIITLIEKQGRDPLLMKIGDQLVCSIQIFKLFSKVIAIRLQGVLGAIIHESQTGFMKGRLIGENIVKLLNLMDYCELNRKSAVVINFDFEKAFDKVKWPAIFTPWKPSDSEKDL